MTNTMSSSSNNNMMKLSTLLLVRHGERADDDERGEHPWMRNPGPRPHDCPLTDQGRAQARFVGMRLASDHLPCTAVYSSPMRRCMETAAEIAHKVGLPVIVAVSLAKSCSYFRYCAYKGRTPLYANASEAAEILRNVRPSVSLQGYIEDDGLDCVSAIQRLLIKSDEEQAVEQSVTLIVGHCETQREIARLSGIGGEIDTAYCGKANFLLEHDQRSGGFWYTVQTPAEDMAYGPHGLRN